ncbi:MAG: aminotransferase class I/II-fold pyridoxal phosphate-dependent enzyme, partial [Bacilli bacterium]|nr:aminotransferase class I/II-fold pyridoxal phosphate-dependent enzyme [Bacilli bacterium]
NEGREWLSELQSYIASNRAYASKFIREEIPALHVIEGDATYLLWVDAREVCGDGKEFARFLREKTGLFVSAGEAYGKGGEGFLRINLAAPLERVKDGLSRLKEGTMLFLKNHGKRC